MQGDDAKAATQHIDAKLMHGLGRLILTIAMTRGPANNPTKKKLNHDFEAGRGTRNEVYHVLA